MCAQHAHNPLFAEKMGLFRYPRGAIKRLKDPSTWLKVATILEKNQPNSFAPPKFGETHSNENEKQIRHPLQRRYPRKYATYPREKIQIHSTPTKHKHEAPSSKKKFFSALLCHDEMTLGVEIYTRYS